MKREVAMGQQIETDARYAVLVEDAATINMMGFAYVCAVVRARAACSSPVSPPIHSSTCPRSRVRTFEDADHDLDDSINEEYRRKYGRFSAVEHITSPKAQATTLRIVRS
jgi:hypothetical protein